MSGLPFDLSSFYASSIAVVLNLFRVKDLFKKNLMKAMDPRSQKYSHTQLCKQYV